MTTELWRVEDDGPVASVSKVWEGGFNGPPGGIRPGRYYVCDDGGNRLVIDVSECPEGCDEPRRGREEAAGVPLLA